jgi:hypothetical protein
MLFEKLLEAIVRDVWCVIEGRLGGGEDEIEGFEERKGSEGVVGGIDRR